MNLGIPVSEKIRNYFGSNQFGVGTLKWHAGIVQIMTEIFSRKGLSTKVNSVLLQMLHA